MGKEEWRERVEEREGWGMNKVKEGMVMGTEIEDRERVEVVRE